MTIFSQKIVRFGVVICVGIYLLDFFLITKTSQFETLENRAESSLSYPIYLFRTAISYLSQSQPPVKPAKSYTIALIGDSMTDYLRGGQDALRDQLKFYYPGKDFVIYNYGFGSTNILSVKNRLINNTSYQGNIYPAILGEQYDLIILESFGNNPLSHLPIREGLQIQTQELDEIVRYLVKNSHTHILFL